MEEDRVDPRKIASSNKFDELYMTCERCIKILESRRNDKTKVTLVLKVLKKAT